MTKTADTNNIVSESISFWEKEKLKALQRGETQRRVLLQSKIHMPFLNNLLPQWEKKKRKRLSQVQIMLEDIVIE